MNTMPTSPRVTPFKKNHQRWAWMAGATAAAAASPCVHGQVAEVTLANNTLDSITGNHLSLMVTAGHPFGTLTHHGIISNAYTHAVIAGFQLNKGTHVTLSAEFIKTPFGSGFNAGVFLARSGSVFFNTFGGNVFGLFPISLTDPNLPGNPTNANAFLEGEAFSQSQNDLTVALLAVFYSESGATAPNLTINTFNGVIGGGDSYTNLGSADGGTFTTSAPEPSELALLALGAGGILARRQRRKAA